MARVSGFGAFVLCCTVLLGPWACSNPKRDLGEGVPSAGDAGTTAGDVSSAGGAGKAGAASSAGTAGKADTVSTAGKAGAAPAVDGGAGGKVDSGGAGSSGSAGAAQQCAPGTHNCSGSCVDDDSPDHCGGRCDACPAPESGTATCTAGQCDFSCGSLHKCGSVCTAGCCIDADCAPQGNKTGLCDTGTHACRYDCAAGTKPCGANNCIPTDHCCSESDCSGTCQTCSSDGTCAAVKSAADADSCSGSCDASGTCKSKQGQTCNTTTNGCIAGTTCAPDGYCCNTACSGSCQACDISGFEGVCTAVASGNPHGNRAKCASDGSACGGSCSGLASGQCSYPTNNCGVGQTCSGSSSIIGQAACANGSCVTPAAQVCTSGFTCSSNACKTSCSADSDCVSGYFCQGGACHLAATQVAMGGESAYALLSDGTVMAWGKNRAGNLGPSATPPVNGSLPVSNVPIKVTSLGKAKAIAAGWYHVCALLTDGTVWCWGGMNQGQVGNGQVTGNFDTFASTPVKVSLPAGVTAIAAAVNNSCALVGSNGAVYCWGDNIYNQLGTGATAQSVGSPVKVAGLGSATAIVSGGPVGCALVSGNMNCWGSNGDSELAQAASGSLATPVIMPLGNLGAIQQMGAGTSHTCALVASGKVYCWGLNQLGDLGDQGTAVGDHSVTPVTVDGLSAGAVQIAVAYLETCATLLDGTAWCWGAESNGALGNGVSAYDGYSAVPAKVSGLSGVTSVAIAERHGCALLNNGSVKCWGLGSDGQLGNGASSDSAVPVAVKGW